MPTTCLTFHAIWADSELLLSCEWDCARRSPRTHFVRNHECIVGDANLLL